MPARMIIKASARQCMMSLCPYASVCMPSSAIRRFVSKGESETLFTRMPHISWPSLRRKFIPCQNCFSSKSASLQYSCLTSFSTTFFFTPLAFRTLFLVFFQDRIHFWPHSYCFRNRPSQSHSSFILPRTFLLITLYSEWSFG